MIVILRACVFQIAPLFHNFDRFLGFGFTFLKKGNTWEILGFFLPLSPIFHLSNAPNYYLLS